MLCADSANSSSSESTNSGQHSPKGLGLILRVNFEKKTNEFLNSIKNQEKVSSSESAFTHKTRPRESHHFDLYMEMPTVKRRKTE